MESFLNVKVTVIPAVGSPVTTDALFDLDGMGNSRNVDKKKLLNGNTLLNVGRKEFKTINFSLPYSETSGGFHDVCLAEYDDNNIVGFEIEFDNAITPTTGDGTKMTGSGKFSTFDPKNDNDALVTSFSFEWEGTPALTKAN